MEEGGDADAEPAGHRVDQLERRVIAGFGQFPDQLRIQLHPVGDGLRQAGRGAGIDPLPGHCHERLGARISLEVPPLSARAHPGRRGRIDEDVATLGGMAVGAVDRRLADDDRAADPGPEREEHQTLEVYCGADPVLTEAGGGGVVGKRHRQPGVV